MYSVGDQLVYGTNGVCKVNEIRNSPFDANDTRMFYVLSPLENNSNLMIYTPTEGGNTVIRDLVSRQEAEALLASVPEIDAVEVPFEKKRRDVYRETVSSASLVDYVRIIKTVAKRRAEFRKSRRRLPDLDNDYEHTARICLYGELSAVLGIDRDEVNNRINAMLEPAE